MSTAMSALVHLHPAAEPASPVVRSKLPEEAVRLGWRVAVAALLAQSLADLTGFALFDGTVGQLNADAEPNLWSWASATATGCAACMLLFLAVALPERRRAFGFLAAATAFLSLDDAVQVHERLSYDVFGLHEGLRLVWPAVYLPLLLAVFALLWRLPRAALPDGRFAVRAGLLMLAAAVGCELISGVMVQFGLDRGTFPYEVEVVAEEGLELVGWIAIASGLTGMLLERAAQPARQLL